MTPHRLLTLLPLGLALCSCASKPGPLDSAEIADYDASVRAQDPHTLLARMATRADEPSIIGGEKDEALTLQILSLLKQHGDTRFAAELLQLTPRQRSAARLFLTPASLGIRDGQQPGSTPFPHTVAALRSSEKITTWPCLVAERQHLPASALSRDGWP